MMFTKSGSSLILFTLFVLCVGCDRNKSPNAPSSQQLFYSSFENTKDLSQWNGVWLENLRSDAPGGGGKLSAYIAGYCIKPHAYAEVGPFNNDLAVRLQCWGKNVADGGVVSMHLKNDEERIIELAIENENWTKYESAEMLNLPKGKILRLELNSAFTVESAILVDVVEVFIVE